MLHWNQIPISMCFRDIWLQIYEVTTLTFQGHVTLLVMWPFNAPYSISYRHSIVTDSLSPAVFEILGPKHIGVTTLPFKVTWRHRSRDESIQHIEFAIGAPLGKSPYLQPFSRYWTLDILGSRPWPFKVTWRHRSRDDSIPHVGFPIGAPLEPSPYL